MKLQTNQYATPYYENSEFTVATGQTDFDVDAQVSNFLSTVGRGTSTTTLAAGVDKFPTTVSIRTDQTVTVKFNSTTDDAITITSSDSPLEISGLEFTNIFITNGSGSTANIKILTLP